MIYTWSFVDLLPRTVWGAGKYGSSDLLSAEFRDAGIVFSLSWLIQLRTMTDPSFYLKQDLHY